MRSGVLKKMLIKNKIIKHQAKVAAATNEEDYLSILNNRHKHISANDIPTICPKIDYIISIEQEAYYIGNSKIPISGGFAGPCRILYAKNQKKGIWYASHISGAESPTSIIESLKQMNVDLKTNQYFIQKGGLSNVNYNDLLIHKILKKLGVDSSQISFLPYQGLNNSPQKMPIIIYKDKFYFQGIRQNTTISGYGVSHILSKDEFQKEPLSETMLAFLSGNKDTFNKEEAISKITYKANNHFSSADKLDLLERLLEVYLITNLPKEDVLEGKIIIKGSQYLSKEIKKGTFLNNSDLKKIINDTQAYSERTERMIEEVIMQYHNKIYRHFLDRCDLYLVEENNNTPKVTSTAIIFKGTANKINSVTIIDKKKRSKEIQLTNRQQELINMVPFDYDMSKYLWQTKRNIFKYVKNLLDPDGY